VVPDLELIHERSDRPRLTWIGHASFLGAIARRWFLVDPVFAGHAGTLYPRYGSPAFTAEQLPEITVALLTHNHYDHLDAGAVRALSPEVPVMAPLGMGRWLRRRGRKRVTELEWWQSVEVDGLEVTLVPSCHWSRRGILDTNRALWGGYVIGCNGQRLYHAGDSAWFDGFREIGRRFPGLLAAMLPIGGYEPAWFMEHYHLNPEQAGRAFCELGARCFVPMHWGAFQLTDEPLCEPADRVRDWWQRQDPGDGRSMSLLEVGETVVLE
jgi:L-ascorbate metabolism protein UlaG (beta-lactamase superfamily)